MKSGSWLVSGLCVCLAQSVWANEVKSGQDEQSKPMEEVWASQPMSREAESTTSVSTLYPQDIESINVATTEDVVKFEPSLVIRRRFIGDANGTLGIRGSNMFQTSRSMVFADGVPLHYLLQSRWNGAPRWSMVSADEIVRVDVIYGPFSAEYSGNAMGGVVVIETAIPEKQSFHFDAGYFSQQFDAYGFKDNLDGYRSFLSYGNKTGNLNYYLSYNHLENDSQPQSFYYGGSSSASNAEAVSGAISDEDASGTMRQWVGDTGVINNETNNYKLKVGYDFGNWQALLNLAFEDRDSDTDSQNSYLRDSDGNTVWSGDVTQDGTTFKVSNSRFSPSYLERQSLSTGLRLRGELNDVWSMEISLSKFDVLKDQNLQASAHPQTASYDGSGQVSEYDGTGWQTMDVKVSANELFGRQDLQLRAGVRAEEYELNYDVYSSDDYRAAEKTAYNSRSGGNTRLDAIWSQLAWDIDPQWDMSVGGRFERWQSFDGYYSDDDTSTNRFDLVAVEEQTVSRFSPKLSVGFKADDVSLMRYSIARAYRFPIVEELYSQYSAYNSISEANPELRPENGLHHNLMLEQMMGYGFVRMNLFQENIRDVIESQTDTLDNGTSVRTFVPVDEVRTRGVELITEQFGLLNGALDVRFNTTWTDSRILRNDADTSIEGNRFPRLPIWRSNLMSSWHVNDELTLAANFQYASDAYNNLDNNDNEDQVYGAVDSYFRIGLRSAWQVTSQWKASVGVDNLTNQIAYVAHPYPGRTWYANISYDL